MVTITPRINSCCDPSGGLGMFMNSSAVMSFCVTADMHTSRLLPCHRFGSDLRYVNPFLFARRGQHGVADVLCAQRVAEVRHRRFALRDALEELDELMHETVLVTDLQAGHPPVAHVRMLALADVD